MKQLALSGTAIAGAYPLLGASDEQMERAAQFQKTAPAFNMCGYAAPKIETVRIGIIGVGMRGAGAVERLSYIEGATVVALGDKYADRIEKAQKTLAGLHNPRQKNTVVRRDGERCAKTPT